jgi:hypothetical protein
MPMGEKDSEKEENLLEGIRNGGKKGFVNIE